MITKFYKRTKELWAAEIQIISIVLELIYIYILVPKTIEIVWVSAAHKASYNFISLTPLFKKLK